MAKALTPTSNRLRAQKLILALSAMILLVASFCFSQAFAQTEPPPPGKLPKELKQLDPDAPGAQRTDPTSLDYPNQPKTSFVISAAETDKDIVVQDVETMLTDNKRNYNDTWFGLHTFWGDDIISNLFHNIGQLFGKWITEFINGWISDTVQFLTGFMRLFVLNPNIAVNGIAGVPGGGPADDISLFIRQTADVIYGIAVDLLLLLFILCIWKFWAEAAWRGGGAVLMGAVGRLICTAGLMLAWPTIYAFEIQITNEMIKTIYFNSADQVSALDDAMAAAVKGGLLAGAALLANATAPVAGAAFGGILGGGPGGLALGTVGGLVTFVGLIIYLFLGGILIFELVYFLVLKAIQTALLTAQYMFAPIFLVFFATPETESVTSGFVRSFVEVSLWTFVWVGMLKIFVIMILSDFNPWGKIVLAVGILQMMIQVPEFIARGKISPVSEFVTAGLVTGTMANAGKALSGFMADRSKLLASAIGGAFTTGAARGPEMSKKADLSGLPDGVRDPHLLKELRRASGRDKDPKGPKDDKKGPGGPDDTKKGPKGPGDDSKAPKGPDDMKKDGPKGPGGPEDSKKGGPKGPDSTKKGPSTPPTPPKKGPGGGETVAPVVPPPGSTDPATAAAKKLAAAVGIPAALAAALAMKQGHDAINERGGPAESDEARKAKNEAERAGDAVNALQKQVDNALGGGGDDKKDKPEGKDNDKAKQEKVAVVPGKELKNKEDEKEAAATAGAADLAAALMGSRNVPPVSKKDSTKGSTEGTAGTVTTPVDKQIKPPGQQNERERSTATADLNEAAKIAGEGHDGPKGPKADGANEKGDPLNVEVDQDGNPIGTPPAQKLTQGKTDGPKGEGPKATVVLPAPSGTSKSPVTQSGKPEEVKVETKPAAKPPGKENNARELRSPDAIAEAVANPLRGNPDPTTSSVVGSDNATDEQGRAEGVVLPKVPPKTTDKTPDKPGGEPKVEVQQTGTNGPASTASGVAAVVLPGPGPRKQTGPAGGKTDGSAVSGEPTTGDSTNQPSLTVATATGELREGGERASRADQPVAKQETKGKTPAAGGGERTVVLPGVVSSSTSSSTPLTTTTEQQRQGALQKGQGGTRPDAPPIAAADGPPAQENSAPVVTPLGVQTGSEGGPKVETGTPAVLPQEKAGGEKQQTSGERKVQVVLPGVTSIAPGEGGTTTVHATPTAQIRPSAAQPPRVDGTPVVGETGNDATRPEQAGPGIVLPPTSTPGATSEAPRPEQITAIPTGRGLEQAPRGTTQQTVQVEAGPAGSDQASQQQALIQQINRSAAARGRQPRNWGEALAWVAEDTAGGGGPDGPGRPPTGPPNGPPPAGGGGGGDDNGGGGNQPPVYQPPADRPPYGQAPQSPHEQRLEAMQNTNPREAFAQPNYYLIPPKGIAAAIRLAQDTTLGYSDSGKPELIGNSKGNTFHVRMGEGQTEENLAMQMMSAGYASNVGSDPAAYDAARASAIASGADKPKTWYQRMAAGIMLYNGSSWSQTANAKQSFQQALYTEAVAGSQAYVCNQEGNAYTQYLRERYGPLDDERQAQAVHAMTDPGSPESSLHPSHIPATEGLVRDGIFVNAAARAVRTNANVLRARPDQSRAATMSCAQYMTVRRANEMAGEHPMVADAWVGREAQLMAPELVSTLTALGVQRGSDVVRTMDDVAAVNATSIIAGIGQDNDTYVQCYDALTTMRNAGMIQHGASPGAYVDAVNRFFGGGGSTGGGPGGSSPPPTVGGPGGGFSSGGGFNPGVAPTAVASVSGSIIGSGGGSTPAFSVDVPVDSIDGATPGAIDLSNIAAPTPMMPLHGGAAHVNLRYNTSSAQPPPRSSTQSLRVNAPPVPGPTSTPIIQTSGNLNAPPPIINDQNVEVEVIPGHVDTQPVHIDPSMVKVSDNAGPRREDRVNVTFVPGATNDNRGPAPTETIEVDEPLTDANAQKNVSLGHYQEPSHTGQNVDRNVQARVTSFRTGDYGSDDPNVIAGAVDRYIESFKSPAEMAYNTILDLKADGWDFKSLGDVNVSRTAMAIKATNPSLGGTAKVCFDAVGAKNFNVQRVHITQAMKDCDSRWNDHNIDDKSIYAAQAIEQVLVEQRTSNGPDHPVQSLQAYPTRDFVTQVVDHPDFIPSSYGGGNTTLAQPVIKMIVTRFNLRMKGLDPTYGGPANPVPANPQNLAEDMAKKMVGGWKKGDNTWNIEGY